LLDWDSRGGFWLLLWLLFPRHRPLDHLLDLIQVERLGHVGKRTQVQKGFRILFAALAEIKITGVVESCS